MISLSRNLFDLSGKKALVTGASRGIGRAIAVGLAEAGADVAVHYHQQSASADQVVKEIRTLGRNAFAVSADLAHAPSVQVLVQATESKLGQIDILILNAGISRVAFVLDVDEIEYQRVLDMNLRAPFLCARAVIPGMISRRCGRIITISSNVAKAPAREMGPHYTASKAGLVGLVRSLALQLAPYNITVNDVAPGPTNTDNASKWTAEQLAASTARIPLGRRGEPSDIVGAVLYLASDAAAWVTGVSLDVNGGFTMG